MWIKKLINKIKNKFIVYYPKPSDIIIDISNICNAQCPFCSRQLSETKRNNLMEASTFYSIMKQLEKIPSIKTISLGAWGEPLAHPKFDEFVDYIKSKGYKIFIPTNFSLANKHFNSLLKCDHILISIEGWDKESYEYLRKNLSFEKTLQNIKDFDNIIKNLEQKPFREINFLVTKNSNVEKFFDCWKPFVDLIRVAPLLPLITFKKDKFQFIVNTELKNSMICLNKLNKNTCMQPFNTIVVRADGNLALCCSDYDSNIDFGNYKNLKKSFFKNKNLLKIRKELKSGNLNICKNCFENFNVDKSSILNEFPILQESINDKKVLIMERR